MNVVFDVNIWISFAIGKRLATLQDVLSNDDITIFYSSQLLSELTSTATKPKLIKYISVENLIKLLYLIDKSCLQVDPPIMTVNICRDPKDDYLLGICQHVKADYLITGDNDLLILKKFKKTSILTYSDFCKILEQ